MPGSVLFFWASGRAPGWPVRGKRGQSEEEWEGVRQWSHQAMSGMDWAESEGALDVYFRHRSSSTKTHHGV